MDILAGNDPELSPRRKFRRQHLGEGRREPVVFWASRKILKPEDGNRVARLEGSDRNWSNCGSAVCNVKWAHSAIQENAGDCGDHDCDRSENPFPAGRNSYVGPSRCGCREYLRVLLLFLLVKDDVGAGALRDQQLAVTVHNFAHLRGKAVAELRHRLDVALPIRTLP